MTNILFITNVICLMINPIKLIIQKILISYYMNLIPCHLWKPLVMLLTLQKRIEDENVAINQARFDEIK